MIKQDLGKLCCFTYVKNRNWGRLCCLYPTESLDFGKDKLFSYGTIRFGDFQTIDGFKVPFTQTIVLNNPKKNTEKYIHQLKLASFSFDGFDKAELYPNKSIKAIGDSKLKIN